MYFSRALIALAAPYLILAQTTSGPNQFKVPPSGYAVTAGQPITLEWSPSTTGTVSLYLRSGNSANLSPRIPIATGLKNSGSYTWDVPADTPRGAGYAVEIVDDGNTSAVNYTPQFALASDVLSSSASGSSSSSSSGSGSMSATMTSSGSMSMSMMSSGSMTTGSSTTSGSSSSQTTTESSSSSSTRAAGAGLQTPSSTGGVGPVATGLGIGFMGGVALAALAL